MKNSIGIYTQFFNNYNYGGNLQAFSLQRFIDNNIGKCEQVVIDFDYKTNLYNYLKSIKNNKGKMRVSTTLSAIKYIIKIFLLPKTYLKLQQRKKRINTFKKEIPHSGQTFNKENIAESLYYSNYICGSDCVWDLTNNSYCTALGFVPDGKKKISYAPSLGSSTIPEGWAEKYLDYIKRLDAISVREKSIAEELQALMPEKEIIVAADPTLLFTAEEWNAFLPHRNNEKDYILHYILSEDINQMLSAVKYSSDCSLKSLTFPNIHNYINYWQRKYGDIQNYSADPMDFVELIKNAEVVVTDSFHAVVLSTLFHKPFYALKRETQKDYVGRVESFLEEVGLLSQMITADELATLDSVPKIDFSYADKVIAEKRKQSIKFLKDNLE